MSSFCQIVREVSNNISDIKVIMCVREVMRKDGVRGRITVLFVSKEKIRELNRRYRGIDAPTDTLSFPFFDDFNSKQNAKNRLYLGEIAVCLEELTITKKQRRGLGSASCYNPWDFSSYREAPRTFRRGVG